MTTQTELKMLTSLRSFELTADLDTLHLRKLATMAYEVEFTADEIIYRAGDVGKAVYLIELGKVVIEMEVPERGHITVLTLGPGQLFGWSSLFPHERKRARARAVEPTYTIAIDSSRLRAAWQTDHRLEHAIIQRISGIMAERVKATRQQLVELLASSKSS